MEINIGKMILSLERCTKNNELTRVYSYIRSNVMNYTNPISKNIIGNINDLIEFQQQLIDRYGSITVDGKTLEESFQLDRKLRREFRETR